MWLDNQTVKALCAAQGLSLRALLRQAGISRSAYYHLIQAPTLIPFSVHKLADTLKIRTSDLLSSGSAEEERYRCRLDKLERLLRLNPKLNRDNIWHMLILLEKEPIERLRGALRRGLK